VLLSSALLLRPPTPRRLPYAALFRSPRQRRRLRRELNQYPSRRARTFLPSERSSPTNPRASEASCGTMPPPTRGLVGEDRSLGRSEEHTSELQSRGHLVCRLLLEKKK